MIWLSAAVPALVAAFVLTAWPYASWGRAGRLVRRSDGSVSHRRRSIERSRRRRAVLWGGVLPVVVAILVGGAGLVLHVWTPWSVTPVAFETADPDTGLADRSMVEAVEKRARSQAEETANALPDQLRVPGNVGLRNWLFQHFPLHPILLLVFAAAIWLLCWWVLAVRGDYLRGLSRRMRAYQRHDLDRLSQRSQSGRTGRKTRAQF